MFGIVKLQLVIFNYFLIHTVFRCFALDHLVLRRPKSFRKTVVDLENWYYNRLMAEKTKNSRHLKVLNPHNIARLSLCISIESDTSIAVFDCTAWIFWTMVQYCRYEFQNHNLAFKIEPAIHFFEYSLKLKYLMITQNFYYLIWPVISVNFMKRKLQSRALCRNVNDSGRVKCVDCVFRC